MNKEAFIGLVAIVVAILAYFVTGSFTAAIQGFFGAGIVAFLVATLFLALFPRRGRP